MREIKENILKLIKSSVLLNRESKDYLFSEIIDSQNSVYLKQILEKLSKENEFIIFFLKNSIKESELLSVIELKDKMARSFLSEMKIKEYSEKQEETINANNLLIQFV